MITFEIIGWIGTALVLGAYFLNQQNYLATDDWCYDVMNLLGALAIGVDVYVSQAWPAFGLQVAWALISIIALVKYVRSKREASGSATKT